MAPFHLAFPDCLNSFFEYSLISFFSSLLNLPPQLLLQILRRHPQARHLGPPHCRGVQHAIFCRLRYRNCRHLHGVPPPRLSRSLRRSCPGHLKLDRKTRLRYALGLNLFDGRPFYA